MSLINDALKTAQRQRTRNKAAQGQNPLFESLVPYPPRSARSANRRRMMFGGVLLVVLIASVGYVRIRWPHWPALSRPKSAIVVPPRAPIVAEQKSAPVEKPADSSHVAAAPLAVATAVKQTGVPAPKHDSVTPPAVAGRVATRGESPPRATSSLRPAPPPVAAASPRDTLQRSAKAIDPPVTQPAPIASPPVTTPSRSDVRVTVDAGDTRPVDALMSQALSAQRQGDLARAKQLYDQAIKMGPVTAPLYNNYGALLTALGNPRDAIAVLRMALSLDRSFTNAWVNMGNALDAVGDHGGAVGSFEQALKLDPSNRESRVNLAEQYLALGAFRDARRMADEVATSDPSYAPAQYALARALEGDKDFRGAAKAFLRFLELGGAVGHPGLEIQVRSHVASLRDLP